MAEERKETLTMKLDLGPAEAQLREVSTRAGKATKDAANDAARRSTVPPTPASPSVSPPTSTFQEHDDSVSNFSSKQLFRRIQKIDRLISPNIVIEGLKEVSKRLDALPIPGVAQLGKAVSVQIEATLFAAQHSEKLALISGLAPELTAPFAHNLEAGRKLKTGIQSLADTLSDAAALAKAVGALSKVPNVSSFAGVVSGVAQANYAQALFKSDIEHEMMRATGGALRRMAAKELGGLFTDGVFNSLMGGAAGK